MGSYSPLFECSYLRDVGRDVCVGYGSGRAGRRCLFSNRVNRVRAQTNDLPRRGHGLPGSGDDLSGMDNGLRRSSDVLSRGVGYGLSEGSDYVCCHRQDAVPGGGQPHRLSRQDHPVRQETRCDGLPSGGQPDRMSIQNNHMPVCADHLPEGPDPVSKVRN